ncbi:MAG: spore cortex-lytic enzyme [Clostridiales bacterium GWD2_32_19]|nr:MAG: spore cortex-lytic enzyme [Clostridiales bacterium GWD2_32_19]
MKERRIGYIILVSIMIIVITISINIVNLSMVNVVAYTWGSRGTMVQQIQQKLIEWGYYNKEVDGVYGYDTWYAVKTFQQKNNILADGIVGNATLSKMGIFSGNVAYAATEKGNLYTWGSTGEKVKEIQRKLKEWDYYNGGIDGDYGYNTWLAVRKFQGKNGLKVDGIAGGNTLEKIGIRTSAKTSKSSAGNVSRDVNILAAAIHGEARGEPYEGMVAVGAVILNRTKSGKFPSTVAGVIYQPGAFDAVDDGQINLAPGKQAISAAKDALSGWDPSSGCIYYWNPATATSKWIWSRDIVAKIGNHYFGK